MTSHDDTPSAAERQGDGVVYVATGERCRAEALRSARTVRHHSPTLQICVFTDIDGLDGELSRIADHTHLIEHPCFSYEEKIAPLLDRPFERTLFLDADTIIRRPLEPIFELCPPIDIAAAHDPWRATPSVEAPEAFVELNTGVILLGNRPAVDDVIRSWRQGFDAMKANEHEVIAATSTQPYYSAPGTPAPILHDQPGFRQAVWHALEAGTIRFASLPDEANLRLWGANALAAGASPWIVHSHAANAAESAADLERSLHARVWLTGLSGGMGDRLSDEIIVGGTFSRPVRTALSMADFARNTVRAVSRASRRLRARVGSPEQPFDS